MEHTQEEIDYIEYYMWRHGAGKPVREIAQELGTGQWIIYQLAKKYNIPVRIRDKADSDICEGRPQSCFNCPLQDCIFSGSSTDDELAYLFSGISKGNDRNKARSRKRRKVRKK